jgi:hypothetical protein
VDTTTHPAGVAGDVNGIGRFTAFENDLVTTKEGGFGAGFQYPSMF